jgi:hypothetical protein
MSVLVEKEWTVFCEGCRWLYIATDKQDARDESGLHYMLCDKAKEVDK